MRRRTRTIAHPFSAWTRLALHTADMMLASLQVIGHRTQRMASAGNKPGARDRREFSTMGREKFVAAGKSVNAMGTHMLALNQRLGTRMVKAGLESTRAMMSLAASPTLAHTVRRQADLTRTVTQAALTPLQLSSHAARIAGHGLKPIRARAKANAKRLGKQRKA